MYQLSYTSSLNHESFEHRERGKGFRPKIDTAGEMQQKQPREEKDGGGGNARVFRGRPVNMGGYSPGVVRKGFILESLPPVS